MKLEPLGGQGGMKKILAAENALLRRGGRRFANKRLREARDGDDDEDRRKRRLHRVSRRRPHRMRASLSARAQGFLLQS